MFGLVDLMGGRDGWTVVGAGGFRVLSAVELEHGGAALGGHRGVGYKEEVSGSGGWGGGPELRRSAAGGDLGDCRSSGCLEGTECVVDLAGGLVVLEGVADLASGQTGLMGLQRGVDLLGERLAGRAV